MCEEMKGGTLRLESFQKSCRLILGRSSSKRARLLYGGVQGRFRKDSSSTTDEIHLTSYNCLETKRAANCLCLTSVIQGLIKLQLDKSPKYATDVGMSSLHSDLIGQN